MNPNSTKHAPVESRNVRNEPNDFTGGDIQEVVDTVSNAICNYSKKNPVGVGVVVFLLGFYVGWKVKPW